MSVSSPPPPDGPPTWLLEMMTNTKEMMNNTKTSLNEIKNAVEQNTSSIASFHQLVKPLADEVARVDMARLEDKVELSEKIENVTSKVATEINEMRTENLTRTKEILDKMKSLEDLVQNKPQAGLSWAEMMTATTSPTTFPSAPELIPQDDGEEPNPIEVKQTVEEAKKIISLQPIWEENIEMRMAETNTDKETATVEEIYEFLELGLGIQDVRSEVNIVKYFRLEQNETNRVQDKLNVVFSDSETTRMIFKHVKKIRNPEIKIMAWIPRSFQKRFRKLDTIAHSLRHGDNACKTSIRWGDDDLVLQRRHPDSRSWETVNVPNLPPVQLKPPAPTLNPSSSPAPGLKKKKRKRSAPEIMSPSHLENKSAKKDGMTKPDEDDVNSKKDHFESLFTPRQKLVKTRSSSSSTLPPPSTKTSGLPSSP